MVSPGWWPQGRGVQPRLPMQLLCHHHQFVAPAAQTQYSFWHELLRCLAFSSQLLWGLAAEPHCTSISHQGDLHLQGAAPCTDAKADCSGVFTCDQREPHTAVFHHGSAHRAISVPRSQLAATPVLPVLPAPPCQAPSPAAHLPHQQHQPPLKHSCH